jgi:tetratricopeptide (TPR) repeat protein
MDSYDVFVSYNSRDAVHAVDLATWLRGQGLKVFLDRWCLIPGHPWLDGLQSTLRTCQSVVVLVGPGEMDRWQLDETRFAMNRQVRQPTFPVIPVLLPGADPSPTFLTQRTWVDLRGGVDDQQARALLAAAIRGLPPSAETVGLVPAPLVNVCPYRGLLFFREEDEPFFFGRDVARQRLLDALKQQDFVALAGASGSGKSSLLRAGLIPFLRREEHCPWEIVRAFPGDRPWKAMAAALIGQLDPSLSEADRLVEVSKLASALADQTVSLRDVADRILARRDGSARVLIAVDQFEELYTLTTDERVRRDFVDALLEAAQHPRVKALIALRGDFIGVALGNRSLSDRMQDAQVNLGPMTPSELAEAVSRPAERMGARFERGLKERLLKDVADQPGNLPLLEFVLRRLWEEKRAGELTHEAYDAMGGLTGALAGKADDVFQAMSRDQQVDAKRVFLQLVRPGEPASQDTRCRARVSDFGAGERAVVIRLANERLLVTTRGFDTEDTVEVSHEALIEGWGRLRAWLNEDREFLLWRDRFRGFMRTWEHAAKDASALLSGPMLSEGKRWSTSRTELLSSEEREFIDRSRQADEAAVREERDRIQQNLRQQRKIARKLMALLGLVTASLVAGIFLYLQTQRRSREADAARNRAEQFVEFMVFELTDKLSLIGRLDLVQGINERVDAYFKNVGQLDATASLNMAAEINRGDVLAIQGDVTGSLAAYRAGIEFGKQVVAAHPGHLGGVRQLSNAYSKLGDLKLRSGAVEEAVAAFEKSRAMDERTVMQDPANDLYAFELSLTYSRLAEGLRVQRRLSEALSILDKSNAILERLLLKEPTNRDYRRALWCGFHLIGMVLLEQDRDEQAVRVLERVVLEGKRLVDEDAQVQLHRVDLATYHKTLAQAWRRRGDTERALAELESARTLLTGLVDQHPTNQQHQRSFAGVMRMLKAFK